MCNIEISCKSETGPTENTLRCAAMGFDTFGRYKCLEHAVETFQRMVSDGIQPDVVTWNTLIDCHCKAGQHERAWEMFEEMRESGCLPCATTYNIMINSLGEERKFDEVKSLLGKMRSEGLLPNAVTYTTLVDIYGQSGRWANYKGFPVTAESIRYVGFFFHMHTAPANLAYTASSFTLTFQLH